MYLSTANANYCLDKFMYGKMSELISDEHMSALYKCQEMAYDGARNQYHLHVGYIRHQHLKDHPEFSQPNQKGN